MIMHVRTFDHVQLGYDLISWIKNDFISSSLKGLKCHHKKTEN